MPSLVSVYDDPHLTIYFGDARDRLYQRDYLKWDRNQFITYPSIQEIVERLSLTRLIFLRQVHGFHGLTISRGDVAHMAPFSYEGDFLITKDSHLGIGVMTADCLPVICYDQQHHVIGIAHAGWRGALQGVVGAMINEMRKVCRTHLKDTLFWFGPGAQQCCYQVSKEFLRQLEGISCAHQVCIQRGDALYFDLPGLVQQQLAWYGVLGTQISMAYHRCTICDARFCSYRRATKQGVADKEGRQMTVVVLK